MDSDALQEIIVHARMTLCPVIISTPGHAGWSSAPDTHNAALIHFYRRAAAKCGDDDAQLWGTSW